MHIQRKEISRFAVGIGAEWPPLSCSWSQAISDHINPVISLHYSFPRDEKPRISPTIAPGFGRGHSLPYFSILAASSSMCKNVDTSSSAAGNDWPGTLPPSSEVPRSLLLLFRILWICCPFSVTIISESARVRRGAGQGKRWGKPTTKNEARSVAAKREEVVRDRGCRWGVISAVAVRQCLQIE
jgi:hypothetical protein